ncbi:hypothetical protein DV735_g4361, partial [Chaetothyriales sp. CBS 134920]
MPATWILVGASRGIGLEFTRQLLARGDQVIAAVRNEKTANELWKLAASQTRPASCLIEQCDVTKEASIDEFADRIGAWVKQGLRIDNIVLNAGVLKYPNRATEVSFADFALHLHTNTIGPIVCARKLLDLVPDRPPAKVIFISSDSGSTAAFREHEDGFGAYAASKAALNQMLRHMAAELKRKKGGSSSSSSSSSSWADVCVLALHPGEVQTDMANIDLDWEVEGIISPEESVRGLLQVIASKSKADSGTFWSIRAQVKLLNSKAAAAVDKLADYEDEVRYLRLQVQQQQKSSLTADEEAQRQLREQAEASLHASQSELEELTSQLFGEANEMVAHERQERAKLELRVKMLEERDRRKVESLDRLEARVKRVERVRALVGQ